MQKAEKLRNARTALLKLHKALIDHERAIFEVVNGPLTSGEFLRVLLEHEDFQWLRRFSTLIVDIDEMFAQKDGFAEKAVDAHLAELRRMIAMEDEDEAFRAKYQAALQQDITAASRHGELKELLSVAPE